MSHIVTIHTEVRDGDAVAAACRRLQWPAPRQGTFQLYSGPATGLGVEIPGWLYPAVCDLSKGEIQFDNYGGEWGDRALLDRLLQAYAVEKAKLEARRKGHTITEQALADGSIKLTVQVAG